MTLHSHPLPARCFNVHHWPGGAVRVTRWPFLCRPLARLLTEKPLPWGMSWEVFLRGAAGGLPSGTFPVGNEPALFSMIETFHLTKDPEPIIRIGKIEPALFSAIRDPSNKLTFEMKVELKI